MTLEKNNKLINLNIQKSFKQDILKISGNHIPSKLETFQVSMNTFNASR